MGKNNIRSISPGGDSPKDQLTERLKAANMAASEIEILCIALREGISDCEQPDLLVRGMTKRIQTLAGVVMSTMNDKNVDTDSLFEEIG